MKALSLKEPWAYAIFNCGKDIENRIWSTKERGRIYIHVSKQFDYDGYRWIQNELGLVLPDKKDFQLGGIIGTVQIVDCVRKHNSRWFFGPYGFVLSDPVKEQFRPYKGRLGFFEIEAIKE